MALNCGIVGLPNVGKSTLFSAITSTKAEAANYPFCTIDPNMGIVDVPDDRLEKIANIVKPERILPASVEFVDIAGLVKGASKGEGLGNQFLGHIRQVGIICHVVRCFEDGNIVHVSGRIDPLDDIQIIEYELAISDLETVQKRLSQMDKLLKSQDKGILQRAKAAKPVLEKLVPYLQEGQMARLANLEKEEIDVIADLHLLTLKQQLFICNVSEEELSRGLRNDHVKSVEEYAAKSQAKVVVICAQVEKEISELESKEEKAEFMESVGLEKSGLTKLIMAAYELLGLRTYFTAGVKEVRAWTFQEGMKAPETAGIIHTDFEKGFIKAEVYSSNDLFEFGSEAKVKEKGKLRLEGKEYVVKDGDVMHFRFNT